VKLHEIDLLSIKINWIPSRICEQCIDRRLIHNTTAQQGVQWTRFARRWCRALAGFAAFQHIGALRIVI
jgi:hypothetical protein